MQTKTRNLLIASVLAVTLGAGAAMACDRHGGFERHGGGPSVMKAMDNLPGLTDEQRSELQKLYDQHRDARYNEYKQSRDERRALRDALSDGADPAVVRPLADKQGQRVAQRIMEKAELMAKVRAILTPEQVQQLQAMAKQRFADRDQRHGDGRRW